MSDASPSRYTLRDLLFGTVALGLFCCLLPSCVARDRHSAIAQCMNNQRQLAMGTLQFANAQGHYPGWHNSLNRRAVSFVVPLLPYLGRSDLQRFFAESDPLPDDAQLKIDLMICPSAKQRPGVASYVINAGQADPDDQLPTAAFQLQVAAGGVAGDYTSDRDARISPDYVLSYDGTMYTLLFSENLQAESWTLTDPEELRRWTTFLWWNEPPTIKPPTYKINVGKDSAPQPTVDLYFTRPSSNHSGGVVATFCDGHNRFVSQDIDYHVYKQLMTPNGAESGDRQNVPLPADY